MTMDVFILAGGLGTRLQSTFPDLPKPIVPVNETPFLLTLLKAWRHPKVRRFVISVGHRAEQVMATVRDNFCGTPIDYSYEATPQGTGGAILNALELNQLTTPFILLNGDTFFPVSIESLMARPEDYVMALAKIDDAHRAGRVELDTHGVVTRFHSPAPGPALVNAGVALIRSLKFNSSERPLSLESTIIPHLLESGERIGSLIVNQPLIDIGTPAGHQEATRILEGVK